MVGIVIVEFYDFVEVFYIIGINLVCNRDFFENINYKFDDIGYIVYLNYIEYIK